MKLHERTLSFSIRLTDKGFWGVLLLQVWAHVHLPGVCKSDVVR